MPSVTKVQRRFMSILLTTFMMLRGKANFRNLSRHSALSEKTYYRGFRKDFDFAYFNCQSISHITEKADELLAVIDCSFCEKSGKKTYGLDKFYNGKNNKSEKGLEISTLAVDHLRTLHLKNF
jgi:hypothetical protein